MMCVLNSETHNTVAISFAKVRSQRGTMCDVSGFYSNNDCYTWNVTDNENKSISTIAFY